MHSVDSLCCVKQVTGADGKNSYLGSCYDFRQTGFCVHAAWIKYHDDLKDDNKKIPTDCHGTHIKEQQTRCRKMCERIIDNLETTYSNVLSLQRNRLKQAFKTNLDHIPSMSAMMKLMLYRMPRHDLSFKNTKSCLSLVHRQSPMPWEMSRGARHATATVGMLPVMLPALGIPGFLSPHTTRMRHLNLGMTCE